MTNKKEYAVAKESTLVGLPSGAGLASGITVMVLNRRNRWWFIPGFLLTAFSAAYTWLVASVVLADKAEIQEKERDEVAVREEHELGEHYLAAGAILGAGLASGTVLRTAGRHKECAWLRRSGSLVLGLTALFGTLVSGLLASFRYYARNETTEQ